MGAFFYIPARFHISPFPLHSFLQSLIAEYNRSHRLLTQLQTLNFIIHFTVFYEWFKAISDYKIEFGRTVYI